MLIIWLYPSTLLIAVFISFAAVAQSEKSIVIEQSSFRAVQSDALTGVNIDPIGEDSSRRPCARIKVRINRMTKEDINAIEVRIATNNELRKCKTAEYDNGLIIEMTAKPNSRFYFYHPRLGYSNEVNVNLEANKEYRIDAYLNQLLSITVMSDAVGADVYIDDMYRGQIGANSTLVVHGISANKHFLVLQYADKKIEQDINVNSENFVFVSNLKSSQQQPIQLPEGKSLLYRRLKWQLILLLVSLTLLLKGLYHKARQIHRHARQKLFLYVP